MSTKKQWSVIGLAAGLAVAAISWLLWSAQPIAPEDDQEPAMEAGQNE